MKKLLFILFFSIPLFVSGQGLTRCIDSFRAIMLTNYPTPTTAQYNYVTQYVTRQCNAIAAYVGGAGYGTMTSLTPGIGFTSHVPITTAGTINIDTVGLIASKAWVTNSIPSLTGYIPYSDTSTKIATHNYVNTVINDSNILIWHTLDTKLNKSDSGIYVSHTQLNDSLGSRYDTLHDISTSHEILCKHAGYILASIDNNSGVGGELTVVDYDGNNSIEIYQSSDGTESHIRYNTELGGTADIKADLVANYPVFQLTNKNTGTEYLACLSDTVTLSNRINLKVNISDSTTKFVTPTQMHDTTLNIWHSISGISTGVTSVATTNGITGGTITSTGTLSADTIFVASRNRVKKVADSITALGYLTSAVTSVATGIGLRGGTITSTGTLTIDSAKVYTSRQVDSDIVSRSYGSGTVTSVAGSRGIGGGTITTTGTHYLDTTQPYTWLGSQTVSISSIGATNVEGFKLINPTAATTVTAQYAPQYTWQGTWYNSTSSASQPYSFVIRNTCNTNVAIPSLGMTWGFNYNGGSFTNLITLTNGGVTLSALGVSGTSIFNGVATFAAAITLTAGKKITNPSGTNASKVNATLASGTVTISNTLVTASSDITCHYRSGVTPTTAVGTLVAITITAGTSFVVNSYSSGVVVNTSDNNQITCDIQN